MSKSNSPRLFRPVQVGAFRLEHRVVLAPLTRMRNKNYVPFREAQQEYYRQRASKGGLLISEATLIHPSAGSYKQAPGLWNAEQIAGWKKVTAGVHEKGGIIFAQLWHLGRASAQTYEYEGKSYPPVAPSAITYDDKIETPRELTLGEVKQLPAMYATAAKNAVEAGFDGVEIHGANGYILDQFIQEVSNKRTDAYGGNAEKRHRLVIETLKAVSEAIGAERVAIRYSPFSTFQGMRDSNPLPNFSKLIEDTVAAVPKLAYIHLIEGRGGAVQFVAEGTPIPESEDLAPLRQIVHKHNEKLRQAGDLDHGVKVITAGGYTPQAALDLSEKSGDLIAFGRQFISNPDLPERIRQGAALTKYDRSTFYSSKGDQSGATGYTDYPTLGQTQASNL